MTIPLAIRFVTARRAQQGQRPIVALSPAGVPVRQVQGGEQSKRKETRSSQDVEAQHFLGVRLCLRRKGLPCILDWHVCFCKSKSRIPTKHACRRVRANANLNSTRLVEARKASARPCPCGITANAIAAGTKRHRTQISCKLANTGSITVLAASGRDWRCGASQERDANVPPDVPGNCGMGQHLCQGVRCRDLVNGGVRDKMHGMAANG